MRLVSNFSKGVLSAPIIATDLVIAITGGGTFPAIAAPDDMVAWLDDGVNREPVLITAHVAGSGNFTVTRAWEKVANAGPAAFAFAAGTKFENRFSAETIESWMRTVPHGHPQAAGITDYYEHPGVVGWHGPNDAFTGFSASTLYYFPWLVETPITIDSLALEVMGTGAGLFRLGIARADRFWQPDKLILDAGTLSPGTSGAKFLSITPITLLPGRYLAMLNTDAAATYTLRSQRAHGPMGFNIREGGTGNLANHIRSMSVARAQSAFPDPPPVATFSLDSGDTWFDYCVLARVSSP